MLELTASLVEEDAGLAKDRRFINEILLQTKEDGYASSVGGSEASISAIALAIPGGGPVLGSINLIFFSSSKTPEAAAKKYPPSMKVAVKEIEQRWSAANMARRSTSSLRLDLDAAKIDQVIGAKGYATAGVYQIGVIRRDGVTMDGMTLASAGPMGVATGINFQLTDGGKAAITGNLVLTGNEVNL